MNIGLYIQSLHLQIIGSRPWDPYICPNLLDFGIMMPKYDPIYDEHKIAVSLHPTPRSHTLAIDSCSDCTIIIQPGKKYAVASLANLKNCRIVLNVTEHVDIVNCHDCWFSLSAENVSVRESSNILFLLDVRTPTSLGEGCYSLITYPRSNPDEDVSSYNAWRAAESTLGASGPDGGDLPEGVWRELKLSSWREPDSKELSMDAHLSLWYLLDTFDKDADGGWNFEEINAYQEAIHGEERTTQDKADFLNILFSSGVPLDEESGTLRFEGLLAFFSREGLEPLECDLQVLGLSHVAGKGVVAPFPPASKYPVYAFLEPSVLPDQEYPLEHGKGMQGVPSDQQQDPRPGLSTLAANPPQNALPGAVAENNDVSKGRLLPKYFIPALDEAQFDVPILLAYVLQTLQSGIKPMLPSDNVVSGMDANAGPNADMVPRIDLVGYFSHQDALVTGDMQLAETETNTSASATALTDSGSPISFSFDSTSSSLISPGKRTRTTEVSAGATTTALPRAPSASIFVPGAAASAPSDAAVGASDTAPDSTAQSASGYISPLHLARALHGYVAGTAFPIPKRVLACAELEIREALRKNLFNPVLAMEIEDLEKDLERFDCDAKSLFQLRKRYFEEEQQRHTSAADVNASSRNDATGKGTASRRKDSAALDSTFSSSNTMDFGNSTASERKSKKAAVSIAPTELPMVTDEEIWNSVLSDLESSIDYEKRFRIVIHASVYLYAHSLYTSNQAVLSIKHAIKVSAIDREYAAEVERMTAQIESEYYAAGEREEQEMAEQNPTRHQLRQLSSKPSKKKAAKIRKECREQALAIVTRPELPLYRVLEDVLVPYQDLLQISQSVHIASALRNLERMLQSEKHLKDKLLFNHERFESDQAGSFQDTRYSTSMAPYQATSHNAFHGTQGGYHTSMATAPTATRSAHTLYALPPSTGTTRLDTARDHSPSATTKLFSPTAALPTRDEALEYALYGNTRAIARSRRRSRSTSADNHSSVDFDLTSYQQGTAFPHPVAYAATNTIAPNTTPAANNTPISATNTPVGTSDKAVKLRSTGYLNLVKAEARSNTVSPSGTNRYSAAAANVPSPFGQTYARLLGPEADAAPPQAVSELHKTLYQSVPTGSVFDIATSDPEGLSLGPSVKSGAGTREKLVNPVPYDVRASSMDLLDGIPVPKAVAKPKYRPETTEERLHRLRDNVRPAWSAFVSLEAGAEGAESEVGGVIVGGVRKLPKHQKQRKQANALNETAMKERGPVDVDPDVQLSRQARKYLHLDAKKRGLTPVFDGSGALQVKETKKRGKIYANRGGDVTLDRTEDVSFLVESHVVDPREEGLQIRKSRKNNRSLSPTSKERRRQRLRRKRQEMYTQLQEWGLVTALPHQTIDPDALIGIQLPRILAQENDPDNPTLSGVSLNIELPDNVITPDGIASLMDLLSPEMKSSLEKAAAFKGLDYLRELAKDLLMYEMELQAREKRKEEERRRRRLIRKRHNEAKRAEDGAADNDDAHSTEEFGSFISLGRDADVDVDDGSISTDDGDDDSLSDTDSESTLSLNFSYREGYARYVDLNAPEPENLEQRILDMDAGGKRVSIPGAQVHGWDGDVDSDGSQESDLYSDTSSVLDKRFKDRITRKRRSVLVPGTLELAPPPQIPPPPPRAPKPWKIDYSQLRGRRLTETDKKRLRELHRMKLLQLGDISGIVQMLFFEFRRAICSETEAAQKFLDGVLKLPCVRIINKPVDNSSDDELQMRLDFWNQTLQLGDITPAAAPGPAVGPIDDEVYNTVDALAPLFVQCGVEMPLPILAVLMIRLGGRIVHSAALVKPKKSSGKGRLNRSSSASSFWEANSLLRSTGQYNDSASSAPGVDQEQDDTTDPAASIVGPDFEIDTSKIGPRDVVISRRLILTIVKTWKQRAVDAASLTSLSWQQARNLPYKTEGERLQRMVRAALCNAKIGIPPLHLQVKKGTVVIKNPVPIQWFNEKEFMSVAHQVELLSSTWIKILAMDLAADWLKTGEGSKALIKEQVSIIKASTAAGVDPASLLVPTKGVPTGTPHPMVKQRAKERVIALQVQRYIHELVSSPKRIAHLFWAYVKDARKGAWPSVEADRLLADPSIQPAIAITSDGREYPIPAGADLDKILALLTSTSPDKTPPVLRDGTGLPLLPVTRTIEVFPNGFEAWLRCRFLRKRLKRVVFQRWKHQKSLDAPPNLGSAIPELDLDVDTGVTPSLFSGGSAHHRPSSSNNSVASRASSVTGVTRVSGTARGPRALSWSGVRSDSRNGENVGGDREDALDWGAGAAFPWGPGVPSNVVNIPTPSPPSSMFNTSQQNIAVPPGNLGGVRSSQNSVPDGNMMNNQAYSNWDSPNFVEAMSTSQGYPTPASGYHPMPPYAAIPAPQGQLIPNQPFQHPSMTSTNFPPSTAPPFASTLTFQPVWAEGKLTMVPVYTPAPVSMGIVPSSTAYPHHLPPYDALYGELQQYAPFASDPNDPNAVYPMQQNQQEHQLMYPHNQGGAQTPEGAGQDAWDEHEFSVSDANSIANPAEETTRNTANPGFPVSSIATPKDAQNLPRKQVNSFLADRHTARQTNDASSDAKSAPKKEVGLAEASGLVPDRPVLYGPGGVVDTALAESREKARAMVLLRLKSSSSTGDKYREKYEKYQALVLEEARERLIQETAQQLESNRDAMAQQISSSNKVYSDRFRANAGLGKVYQDAVELFSGRQGGLPFRPVDLSAVSFGQTPSVVDDPLDAEDVKEIALLMLIQEEVNALCGFAAVKAEDSVLAAKKDKETYWEKKRLEEQERQKEAERKRKAKQIEALHRSSRVRQKALDKFDLSDEDQKRDVSPFVTPESDARLLLGGYSDPKNKPELPEDQALMRLKEQEESKFEKLGYISRRWKETAELEKKKHEAALVLTAAKIERDQLERAKAEVKRRGEMEDNDRHSARPRGWTGTVARKDNGAVEGGRLLTGPSAATRSSSTVHPLTRSTHNTSFQGTTFRHPFVPTMERLDPDTFLGASSGSVAGNTSYSAATIPALPPLSITIPHPVTNEWTTATLLPPAPVASAPPPSAVPSSTLPVLPISTTVPPSDTIVITLDHASGASKRSISLPPVLDGTIAPSTTNLSDVVHVYTRMEVPGLGIVPLSQPIPYWSAMAATMAQQPNTAPGAFGEMGDNNYASGTMQPSTMMHSYHPGAQPAQPLDPMHHTTPWFNNVEPTVDGYPAQPSTFRTRAASSPSPPARSPSPRSAPAIFNAKPSATNIVSATTQSKPKLPNPFSIPPPASSPVPQEDANEKTKDEPVEPEPVRFTSAADAELQARAEKLERMRKEQAERLAQIDRKYSEIKDQAEFIHNSNTAAQPETGSSSSFNTSISSPSRYRSVSPVSYSLRQPTSPSQRRQLSPSRKKEPPASQKALGIGASTRNVARQQHSDAIDDILEKDAQLHAITAKLNVLTRGASQAASMRSPRSVSLSPISPRHSVQYNMNSSRYSEFQHPMHSSISGASEYREGGGGSIGPVMRDLEQDLYQLNLLPTTSLSLSQSMSPPELSPDVHSIQSPSTSFAVYRRTAPETQGEEFPLATLRYRVSYPFVRPLPPVSNANDAKPTEQEVPAPVLNPMDEFYQQQRMKLTSDDLKLPPKGRSLESTRTPSRTNRSFSAPPSPPALTTTVTSLAASPPQPPEPSLASRNPVTLPESYTTLHQTQRNSLSNALFTLYKGREERRAKRRAELANWREKGELWRFATLTEKELQNDEGDEMKNGPAWLDDDAKRSLSRASIGISNDAEKTRPKSVNGATSNDSGEQGLSKNGGPQTPITPQRSRSRTGPITLNNGHGLLSQSQLNASHYLQRQLSAVRPDLAQLDATSDTLASPHNRSFSRSYRSMTADHVHTLLRGGEVPDPEASLMSALKTGATVDNFDECYTQYLSQPTTPNATNASTSGKTTRSLSRSQTHSGLNTTAGSSRTPLLASQRTLEQLFAESDQAVEGYLQTLGEASLRDILTPRPLASPNASLNTSLGTSFASLSRTPSRSGTRAPSKPGSDDVQAVAAAVEYYLSPEGVQESLVHEVHSGTRYRSGSTGSISPMRSLSVPPRSLNNSSILKHSSVGRENRTPLRDRSSRRRSLSVSFAMDRSIASPIVSEQNFNWTNRSGHAADLNATDGSWASPIPLNRSLPRALSRSLTRKVPTSAPVPAFEEAGLNTSLGDILYETGENALAQLPTSYAIGSGGSTSRGRSVESGYPSVLPGTEATFQVQPQTDAYRPSEHDMAIPFSPFTMHSLSIPQDSAKDATVRPSIVPQSQAAVPPSSSIESPQTLSPSDLASSSTDFGKLPRDALSPGGPSADSSFPQTSTDFAPPSPSHGDRTALGDANGEAASHHSHAAHTTVDASSPLPPKNHAHLFSPAFPVAPQHIPYTPFTPWPVAQPTPMQNASPGIVFPGAPPTATQSSTASASSSSVPGTSNTPVAVSTHGASTTSAATTYYPTGVLPSTPMYPLYSPGAEYPHQAGYTLPGTKHMDRTAMVGSPGLHGDVTESMHISMGKPMLGGSAVSSRRHAQSAVSTSSSFAGQSNSTVSFDLFRKHFKQSQEETPSSKASTHRSPTKLPVFSPSKSPLRTPNKSPTRVSRSTATTASTANPYTVLYNNTYQRAPGSPSSLANASWRSISPRLSNSTTALHTTVSSSLPPFVKSSILYDHPLHAQPPPPNPFPLSRPNDPAPIEIELQAASVDASEGGALARHQRTERHMLQQQALRVQEETLQRRIAAMEEKLQRQREAHAKAAVLRERQEEEARLREERERLARERSMQDARLSGIQDDAVSSTFKANPFTQRSQVAQVDVGKTSIDPLSPVKGYKWRKWGERALATSRPTSTSRGVDNGSADFVVRHGSSFYPTAAGVDGSGRTNRIFANISLDSEVPTTNSSYADVPGYAESLAPFVNSSSVPLSDRPGATGTAQPASSLLRTLSPHHPHEVRGTALSRVAGGAVAGRSANTSLDRSWDTPYANTSFRSMGSVGSVHTTSSNAFARQGERPLSPSLQKSFESAVDTRWENSPEQRRYRRRNSVTHSSMQTLSPSKMDLDLVQSKNTLSPRQQHARWQGRNEEVSSIGHIRPFPLNSTEILDI